MGWCRVVGPRGLGRPLDEKHPPLAPCKGRSKCQHLSWFNWVAALLQFSYTGFRLPHRSDGTLCRVGHILERAPMQTVSGALGSLGLHLGVPNERLWVALGL